MAIGTYSLREAAEPFSIDSIYGLDVIGLYFFNLKVLRLNSLKFILRGWKYLHFFIFFRYPVS